jgi:hypothetical protein
MSRISSAELAACEPKRILPLQFMFTKAQGKNFVNVFAEPAVST